jgi:hypothetical protein
MISVIIMVPETVGKKAQHDDPITNARKRNSGMLWLLRLQWLLVILQCCLLCLFGAFLNDIELGSLYGLASHSNLSQENYFVVHSSHTNVNFGPSQEQLDFAQQETMSWDISIVPMDDTNLQNGTFLAGLVS